MELQIQKKENMIDQIRIKPDRMKPNLRCDPRLKLKKFEKIKITTKSGAIFAGETFDVSTDSIGFQSSGRLQLMEVVEITPAKDQKEQMKSILGPVQIVRIEQSKGQYHYGAIVTDNFEQ